MDGLGDTGILFLPNAQTDTEARSEIEISDRIDRRRHTLALYRIACVIDERAGKDENEIDVVRGRVGRFMYILTGSDAAKKLHSDIFGAESVPVAIDAARKREWRNIRLYQCEEVPLT
ncbi:MAG: hypothetical protein KBD06_02870 [Candidatus Pacebacteria bacterium]|nr:hypothetical protein [Candidatus Paceibacterota bacterium]